MPDRILVVDDEFSLQETLAYSLERQGYEVKVVGDGKLAIEVALTFLPDLIVLDIMLPGMNGFEVCRAIRQYMNIPILFLSARNDEIDRIFGFEMGGDDYIAKPFSMRELLARVKAHLRLVKEIRKQYGEKQGKMGVGGLPQPRKFGNLTFTEKRGEILLNQQPIVLKPREYDLLVFFSKHVGKLISREQILQNVWGQQLAKDHRSVDVHIHWLREKIEADPANPTRIVTVWGRGYRFDG